MNEEKRSYVKRENLELGQQKYHPLMIQIVYFYILQLLTSSPALKNALFDVSKIKDSCGHVCKIHWAVYASVSPRISFFLKPL